MPERHEVQWVEISGHRVPAPDLVCPVCNALDLNLTAGDCTPCIAGEPTTASCWGATCSHGHHWHFPIPPLNGILA